MTSIANLGEKVTKKEIADAFRDRDISLHPAGVWKWDAKRKKTAIDAERKDGLNINAKKYANDNMFKHRAEESGVCVIDNDGAPVEQVFSMFPSCKKTFTTTTSSARKQHYYLYPPKGKLFPEARNTEKDGVDIDFLTNGIVFEGHDYNGENSEFSMNSKEIVRCSMAEYDLICEILEPKAKANVVQNKFADNKNPIVRAYNETYSCEELLRAQGYISIRDRLQRPNSTSNMAGVYIFEDGCVYSHGGDWMNDGSSHDAFDIYTHYEHDGDKSKAMAGARDLLGLNHYGFKKSEVAIDHKRVKYIKDNVGYSNQTKMFYMVNSSGKLVQCTAKDFWDFVDRTFPPPFNRDKPQEEMENAILELSPDLTEKERKDAIKELGEEASRQIKYIASVQSKALIDIKYSNDFEVLDYQIDPFAKECSLKVIGKTMFVVANNLFPNIDIDMIRYDYEYSRKVLADFKQHYPQFSEILDMVIASRMGGDRKNAFLYTQMPSNFGKSFLAQVFRNLGLLVEIKEKELRKAFSGDPVAMDAVEFQTAFILFFDEFKTAIGELKDITHHLKLSPKNKLRQEVQLFTKWASSAESSQSLLGNGGVEKQFANRFSYIEGNTGILTERKLYNKDQKAYMDGLTYAVYSIIKRETNRYIEMGKSKASIEANKVMDGFREKYAMKATLDDNVEEMVDEIMEYLRQNLYSGSPMLIGEGIDSLKDLANNVFILHEKKKERLVYIRKPQLLSHFFEEYARNEYGEKHYHKIAYKYQALRDRFGDRTTISIKGKKYNVYPEKDFLD